MKKLFTKIVGISLGIAMAIGVGVGISSNRNVTRLNADEELAYSLAFVNSANSASAISSTTNASTTIASTSRTYVTTQPYTVVSGNNYYGGPTDAEKASIRIGKSGNAASLSITLSASGQVKATKFIVNCMVMSGNKNAGGTLSLNGMAAQEAPTSADNLTFTFASATDITAISLESSKAVFVYSIDVYRYKAPSKTLSSIALSGTYPTSFEQGDEFSHEGMTVTATYSDSTTANVTASATFSGYDMSEDGDQTVTVSYTEDAVTKTATYDINVAPATLYTVSGTITNGSLSSTASIRENNALNINIVANDKCSLPATLGEVTMGGDTLTAGSGYTYNSSTGAFSITSVTGNVVINATCSKDYGYWPELPYSISDARSAIDSGVGVTGVYATGIVSEIVTAYDPGFGNVSFNMSTDGDTAGEQLQAYRCGGAEAENVEVGDTVIVTGNLTNYKGTYEFGQGCSVVSRTAPSFTITYNANGATGGTVPVDNTLYVRHSDVTVASNSGTLVRTNYEFNGWNTNTNPAAVGAVHYAVGETFEILENTVLYAEWLSTLPSITVQENLAGYTCGSVDLDFTYGHIPNDELITVVAADSKVSVGDLVVIDGDGLVTINFNTAGNTSLSFRYDGEELATCSVTVNQSTVSITGLPSTESVYVDELLDLGSTIEVSKVGDCSLGVTWESEDIDIAEVDSDGIVTGKAKGVVDITVTSVYDPNATMTCSVTVTNAKILAADEIEAGDVVIMACSGTSNQYAGPSNANASAIGLGTSYTTIPDKSGLSLEVEDGYSSGTFAFKLTSGLYKDQYLAWSSGNSLKVSEDLDNNSSWKVSFDTNGNATIKNAADESRIIWWNVSSPRFACYTDKEDGASYKYTQLWKVVTPETYLSDATSTAELINGVNVSMKLGAEVPEDTWTAIEENWGIDFYGVMLFRTTEANIGSVLSVREYFEGNPADVTIVKTNDDTAPDLVGGIYRFSVQINFRNTSSYDRIYCAAPFFVIDGDYYFLPEVRESVNSLLA